MSVVAAAQFTAAPGDLSGNLAAAQRAVDAAAVQDARLLVLPECCLSGYDLEWFAAGAPGGGVTLPDPRVGTLAAHAHGRGLSVVVNDLERDGGRLYSTSFVLSGGSVVGRHRKTIVTEAEERAGLSPGDRAAEPVTLPGVPVPVAPMVCFEHGFPELALDLALGGAGLVAMSSAIRRGSEYLRDLRTRARAQDNGMYVVAANAVGHGFCGESMIVDPRGAVVARAGGDGPDLVVAEVSAAMVAEQRRDEPVLIRRRPALWSRA